MLVNSNIKAVSLAVLPFDNFTGNIENDYFSRGFLEDLITDLSRFPNLNIISSNTSLSENLPADAAAAEKYGINYFLKGSFRSIKDKIRISTQLFNPYDQSILWAEKYDASIEQIFEIHDSIIEKVVSSLSVKIDMEQLAFIRKKDITQLEAYDSWLKGYEYLRRGTIKDDEKARNIFKNALEIDPHFGRAYAGLSLSYFNEWTCQLWEKWDETINMAFEYANKAVKYSSDDHIVQMILGRVLLYRRNFELAEKYLDKSYEMNPNDADCLVQIASCKALLGKHAIAVEIFDRAIRLNPLHYDWYNLYGMMIYFAAGNYEKVISLGESIPLYLSVDLTGYLSAAYAAVNNLEKAKYYIDLYKKFFKEKITYGENPLPGEELDWIIAVNPFKNENDVKKFIAFLEKAGLEKNERGKSYYSESLFEKSAKSSYLFKKIGDVWTIAFNNLAVQLSEVKGFIDISKLLSCQGVEVHCSELMGNITSLNKGVLAIDDKAKKSYQKKIENLQEELREAEDMNDIGRAELLSNELNQIIEHLSKSTGIHGQPRKLSDESEKARAAVTLRIKSAIQKIENVHPSLAKHFQNNIKTGTFCIYSPENPVKWNL